MTTYIAVDVETTGTRPNTDAIIEIGIVRFDETGTILSEYETLLNPGREIPPEIVEVTGIAPAMIANAPHIAEIRARIVAELSDGILVGHNLAFDLAFLEGAGIPLAGRETIDTFHLARLFSYREVSLNLGALCTAYGLALDGAHRALADARATSRLFLRYLATIRDLDPARARIFAHFAARSPVGGLFGHLVGYADEAIRGDPGEWSRVCTEILLSLRQKNVAPIPVDESATEPVPELSVDGVLAVMADLAREDGRSIEERPEQRRMMGLVEAAVADREDTVIEAPTGIGKTFAYLVPSLVRAIPREQTVFVSTHTKLLQDQILDRDVPFLRRVFERCGVPASRLRVAKLKGRNNYLSLALFFEKCAESTYDLELFVFLARTCFWLTETSHGECDELVWYGRENEWLDGVRATSAYALARENPYRDEEFLQVARKRAKDATLLVLNHSLLLADYADDNVSRRILPAPDHLVLDEAHTLEDVVTQAVRERASFEGLEESFAEIDAAIRQYNNKAKETRSEAFVFPEWAHLRDAALLDAGMLFDFFSEYFVRSSGVPVGEDTREILRKDDIFLHESYPTIERVLSAFSHRIDELVAYLYQAPEKLVARLESRVEDIETVRRVLEKLVVGHETEEIHILSSLPRGRGLALSVVPLRVGDFLQKALWSTAATKVLASATMTVGGSFESLSRMLGLEKFAFHRLASDFDYASQALLFVPDDLGDVRKVENRFVVHDFLQRLLLAVRGRSLVLFTSFASIKEAYLATNPALKEAGVRVLAQGFAGGKQRMLADYLANADTSVIYGTDTFWQGIDIPGRDLETLVIHKLPFAVPTDPVYGARSTLYENPFREYALPLMVLKLRQGIGRLIRSKSDKGIVVLLDNRVLTDWGRVVLQNVPEGMKVRVGGRERFLEQLSARLSGDASEG